MSASTDDKNRAQDKLHKLANKLWQKIQASKANLENEGFGEEVILITANPNHTKECDIGGANVK